MKFSGSNDALVFKMFCGGWKEISGKHNVTVKQRIPFPAHSPKLWPWRVKLGCIYTEWIGAWEALPLSCALRRGRCNPAFWPTASHPHPRSVSF